MIVIGPPYILDPKRAEKVRAFKGDKELNGLEFVEVEVKEKDGKPPALRLFFVKEVSRELTERLKSGGLRIDLPDEPNAIEITAVETAGPEVVLTLNRTGGNQTCTLRLVEPGTDDVLAGIDPFLSAVDFSFLTNCPVDVDVVPVSSGEPARESEPAAHYLARDYPTFLQLMYDRLALTLPDWNERHAPDLMVTLLELFAYAGDYLSYYQDVVATEAYLATARYRISVRRHARLVDYQMHEGCNARAWVCVTVADDVKTDRKITFVASAQPDAPVPMNKRNLTGPAESHVFFESIGAMPVELRVARNHLRFYTGGVMTELPAGATSAIVICPGKEPSLVPGQAMMITWAESQSHVVRLINVSALPADPLVDPLKGPLEGTCLTRVEWSASDALPAPVPLADAMVYGNVILVDQGRTCTETVGIQTTGPGLIPTFARTGGWCKLPTTSVVFAVPFPDAEAASRFQARLLGSLKEPAEITIPFAEQTPERNDRNRRGRHRHGQRRNSIAARARRGYSIAKATLQWLRAQYKDPAHKAIHDALEHSLGSASSAMNFIPSDAIPDMTLRDPVTGKIWHARANLLDSAPDDCHFMVEVDDDGGVWLQFGNGDMGASPEPNQIFEATYRVGGEPAGVARSQIASVFVDGTDISVAEAIQSVYNPAHAFGGCAPETTEDVKRLAPGAFRQRRERAVVPADYAELASEISGVAGASASVDYLSGADHVRIAVLPGPMLVTAKMRSDLIDEVGHRLARYRRIGHDISVVQALRIPLEVGLQVQIEPGRRRAEVESDVINALSNRRLADGSLGFFHPDNLSLGQTLAGSDLLARVQAVPGVQSVVLNQFRRTSDSADDGPRATLRFAADEIPQLDNDPRHPSHGRITLVQDQSGGAQ